MQVAALAVTPSIQREGAIRKGFGGHKGPLRGLSDGDPDPPGFQKVNDGEPRDPNGFLKRSNQEPWDAYRLLAFLSLGITRPRREEWGN